MLAAVSRPVKININGPPPHGEPIAPPIYMQKPELNNDELEGIVSHLLAPSLSEAKQEEYEWYLLFKHTISPDFGIRLMHHSSPGTYIIKRTKRWLLGPQKRRM